MCWLCLNFLIDCVGCAEVVFKCLSIWVMCSINALIVSTLESNALRKCDLAHLNADSHSFLRCCVIFEL